MFRNTFKEKENCCNVLFQIQNIFRSIPQAENQNPQRERPIQIFPQNQ